MQTVVLKVGGDIVGDATLRTGLCKNIAALIEQNVRVVVLHGGGPQVSALQTRLGMRINKVGGRRITSPDDLVVVRQAICGEVNTALTAELIGLGVQAFGCHGASGALIQATKRPPRIVSGAGDAPIDFGEVGDVTNVQTDIIEKMFDAGWVPVIGTLGIGSDGRLFNINADTTVIQIAMKLKADALLMVTAVGGIFRDLNDPSSRLSVVTEDEAHHLIRSGVIAGGMIPKVEEAMRVFSEGVGAVCILGPDNERAFVDALAGGGHYGTRIVPTTD